MLSTLLIKYKAYLNFLFQIKWRFSVSFMYVFLFPDRETSFLEGSKKYGKVFLYIYLLVKTNFYYLGVS
jgi:hypothetical protein